MKLSSICIILNSMNTVLFICTHNSARSQMAEGLLRHLYGNKYNSVSAGTAPGKVHPLSIKALAEIGIDISNAKSKNIEEFAHKPIEYVVTVCDNAKENCPYLPATIKNIHHKFIDPSQVKGSEEEKLASFRQVRDTIKSWIIETFGKSGNDAS